MLAKEASSGHTPALELQGGTALAGPPSPPRICLQLLGAVGDPLHLLVHSMPKAFQAARAFRWAYATPGSRCG